MKNKKILILGVIVLLLVLASIFGIILYRKAGTLTIEEKKFINARYYNNYTQEELANIYNTNQVKICRDEKKILSKLKAKMS